MPTRSQLTRCSNSLQMYLGQGKDRALIVRSALLSAISLFYVFTVGSHLPVIVYFFLTRFTYIKPFNDYIVTRYFDSLIISVLTLAWLVLSINGKSTKILISSAFGLLLALAILANLAAVISFIELTTLPLIVFVLSIQVIKNRRRSRKIPKIYCLGLTFNYISIIALALGIYSILISLSVIFASQTFSVENVFSSRRMPVDNNGYEIFILFSALSPILLIIIFFGYPVKYFTKALFKKLPGANKGCLTRYELNHFGESIRSKYRFASLLAIILFSMSLAIIPQTPTVNKDNQQIGSDSESYVEWISLLQQKHTIIEFLDTAFIDVMKGDRPLSLIFIFLFVSVIDAPLLDAVEYVPIVLGPALVLVVYFLSRELTANERTSLFAASLTGLGYFQVSMGIYAGFYANWIALLAGYTSLIFLFRFLRSADKKSLLIFLALLLAMLFSHAYTWAVFSIVMGVYFIVSFLLKSFPKKNTILGLIAVILSLVVDVVKTSMVEAYGSAGGVKLTISLAQSTIGLNDIGQAWATLVDATQHHYGGILCNFLILGLVIYWLVRSNLRTDSNVFFVVFIMIGIPLLFFGDWVLQSRAFYNIPFQIPAAIALTYISRSRNSLKILAPIYIWLVAISIWTVSNFYEVTPS